ncbi:hypothetical protein Dimus_033522, partial [Dionaea muscipula]
MVMNIQRSPPRDPVDDEWEAAGAKAAVAVEKKKPFRISVKTQDDDTMEGSGVEWRKRLSGSLSSSL